MRMDESDSYSADIQTSEKSKGVKSKKSAKSNKSKQTAKSNKSQKSQQDARSVRKVALEDQSESASEFKSSKEDRKLVLINTVSNLAPKLKIGLRRDESESYDNESVSENSVSHSNANPKKAGKKEAVIGSESRDSFNDGSDSDDDNAAKGKYLLLKIQKQINQK